MAGGHSTAENPSLGRRLASLLYDGILSTGVAAVGVLLPHLLLGIGVGVTAAGWLLWLHLILLLGGYFVWNWHRGGQTLAMRTWRIRIISRNGDAPSLRRLCLRYALAWPSIACLGAGLVWAAFDRDRLFLHDRLAGTRLVYVPD